MIYFNPIFSHSHFSLCSLRKWSQTAALLKDHKQLVI